jgi:hypothetical protein
MPLLSPISNTVFLNSYTNNNGLCIFSEQEYKYILLRKKNHSKLRNIVLCVLLKTVIRKDWEHLFIESDLKHRISK